MICLLIYLLFVAFHVVMYSNLIDVFETLHTIPNQVM